MTRQALIADIQQVLARYANVPPDAFIPAIRQMLLDFAALDTNGRQRDEPARTETVIAGVRCVTTRSEGTSPDAGVILYVHGGGFVAGSPETHLGLINRLAQISQCSVTAPDYPLLPECTGAQQLEALMAIYREVAAAIPADQAIHLVGDSAGGLLALSMAQHAAAQHLRLPGAVATLSAMTDLTLSGESYAANAGRDIMLSKDMLGALSALYLAGSDPRDGALSPLHAELAGFPPLLMQVGADEILRDDSVMMVDAVKAAGGQATLEVWPDLFHVWQNFPSRIPESVQALSNVARFLASAHSAGG